MVTDQQTAVAVVDDCVDSGAVMVDIAGVDAVVVGYVVDFVTCRNDAVSVDD